MKFKKLTEYQILISIDRLTRFKNTKEKYFRVFCDILTENLIEPKFKKSEIENLDSKIITQYVTEIFNSSIGSNPTNLEVNTRLKDYENSVFNNSEEVQNYLDNSINYQEAIKLIKDESIINLKWLKALADENYNENYCEKYELKFPIKKVILAEGITEEILVPAFSKFLNYDFYKKGVQIIGAGGKNQVVKMYYKLAEELKIPIFILLDKDAEENIHQIEPKLRKIDRIHPVSCGEFEDLLPKSLVIKTVNSHFKNFLTITENDFVEDIGVAKQLEELFKTKGLHEFKKAEFAKLVRENIIEDSDISEEIEIIIKEISNA